MLGDMDIEHVPTISYNLEENGISERLILTLMNAVKATLRTVKLHWSYWTYVLDDAVDKYNQLPHSVTGKSPHQV